MRKRQAAERAYGLSGLTTRLAWARAYRVLRTRVPEIGGPKVCRAAAPTPPSDDPTARRGQLTAVIVQLARLGWDTPHTTLPQRPAPGESRGRPLAGSGHPARISTIESPRRLASDPWRPVITI